MKRNCLLSFAATLTFLFSLCSCSSETIGADTIKEADSHNHDTIQTDNTPAYSSATKVFENVRSLKRESESDAATPEIPVYYELSGLPSDYIETSVELTGSSYCIYYSRDDSVVAFIPAASETELDSLMEDLLRNSGTYEALENNKMVDNLSKTELSAARGFMYECTYNTGRKSGLKLNYHEYRDEETNVTYIISKTYAQTDDILNSKLFVFNGSSSFACIGSETDINMEEAYNLTSVPIP